MYMVWNRYEAKREGSTRGMAKIPRLCKWVPFGWAFLIATDYSYKTEQTKFIVKRTSNSHQAKKKLATRHWHVVCPSHRPHLQLSHLRDGCSKWTNHKRFLVKLEWTSDAIKYYESRANNILFVVIIPESWQMNTVYAFKTVVSNHVFIFK